MVELFGRRWTRTDLLERVGDIGQPGGRDLPLCWRTSTGEVAAQNYEPASDGWLRGFSGGLMVTCGLTTDSWAPGRLWSIDDSDSAS